MGLMDRLSLSLRRFVLVIVGFGLLLLAGFLALSFVLRYITYTLWYLTPIFCAIVALVGLALLGYAVFFKE